MATLTKILTRGSKTLAESRRLSVGWSNWAEGPRFVLRMHEHQVSLTRAEAERLLADLQARLADPELLAAEARV